MTKNKSGFALATAIIIATFLTMMITSIMVITRVFRVDFIYYQNYSNEYSISDKVREEFVAREGADFDPSFEGSENYNFGYKEITKDSIIYSSKWANKNNSLMFYIIYDKTNKKEVVYQYTRSNSDTASFYITKKENPEDQQNWYYLYDLIPYKAEYGNA